MSNPFFYCTAGIKKNKIVPGWLISKHSALPWELNCLISAGILELLAFTSQVPLASRNSNELKWCLGSLNVSPITFKWGAGFLNAAHLLWALRVKFLKTQLLIPDSLTCINKAWEVRRGGFYQMICGMAARDRGGGGQTGYGPRWNHAGQGDKGARGTRVLSGQLRPGTVNGKMLLAPA